jgi:hypothetical protein
MNKLRKSLITLILSLSISHIGCGSDELIIYNVRKPQVQTQINCPSSTDTDDTVNIPVVVGEDKLNRPVIELIKKKLPKPKLSNLPQVNAPTIFDISKTHRNCEPTCTFPTECNHENGKCEGLAKGNKLQDKHSEVLYSFSSGTFDPRYDEYLQMNR